MDSKKSNILLKQKKISECDSEEEKTEEEVTQEFIKGSLRPKFEVTSSKQEEDQRIKDENIFIADEPHFFKKIKQPAGMNYADYENSMPLSAIVKMPGDKSLNSDV